MRLLYTLWTRLGRHQVPDLAAQLSFYFLLSLFPFLLFALTLLAYLPISTEQVLAVVEQYLPSVTFPLVENNIRRVLDIQRPHLLSFSLLLSLWSASNGSHAVIKALNLAYDIEEKRSFLRVRLVALGLIVGLFLAFLIALLLPVFGRTIGLALAGLIGLSDEFVRRWELVRWLLSLGVTTLVFAYVYLLAPNTSLSVRDVWLGAVFASLGWQLVSWGFSFYVERFGQFSLMYGGIGGAVVFILWLYLAGLVILVGGEINGIMRNRRKGT